MMTLPQGLLGMLVVAAVLLIDLQPAAAQSITPDRLRESATRAVSAIQKSQAVWLTRRGCPSCHHQFQPAIGLARARAHGIPLDERALAATSRRSFDYRDVDESLQALQDGVVGLIEPALGAGYRLIAAHASGVPPNLSTNIVARLLMARQHPDGHWTGMSGRPPSSSSDFTKTALGLRAVQLYRHHADEGAAHHAVAKAVSWLNAHRARNTEDRTFQLLGLSWGGMNARRRTTLARTLAATQQPDGGWASLDGRASEAYSTAEALIALHEAGAVSTSDTVWQRGLAFLLRTQGADGTWHVPSRIHVPGISPPYFESGYPYGHDQFISIAGAAWALMALVAPLPRSDAPSVSLAFADDSSPIDAWIEPAVFGSVADLRRLLDQGLDVNATTVTGRTSLLMMVSDDLQKARLLIDRGANVNARARSGVTALQTAALFRNSTPVIELLLARGAALEPTPPSGSAIPYPLVLAAHAGNAGILERLHKAGDPLHSRVNAPGAAASAGPMGKAIRNGDLDVVTSLLNLGASVSELDGEVWTPLDLAVNHNRVEIARQLLAAGADIDHVNARGYTALMLAASIDFGDSAMMALLLQQGARADIKGPSGKTALDLAREYQHQRFIPLLTRRTSGAEPLGLSFRARIRAYLSEERYDQRQLLQDDGDLGAYDDDGGAWTRYRGPKPDGTRPGVGRCAQSAGFRAWHRRHLAAGGDSLYLRNRDHVAGLCSACDLRIWWDCQWCRQFSAFSSRPADT